MRGQLAQTGHCVCKYMQLEHEHVEAVERYWLFCFVVALSSATDVRPQCSAALREQRRCEMHVAHARFFCFVRAAGDAA